MHGAHTFLGNAEDSGLGGAVFSLLSAVTSFCAHGLPTVQFVAAIVAIIVGTLSIVRIINRWSWDRRPDQPE